LAALSSTVLSLPSIARSATEGRPYSSAGVALSVYDYGRRFCTTMGRAACPPVAEGSRRAARLELARGTACGAIVVDT
jgi:hypothetical protein